MVRREDREHREHARLAPSGAAQWMNCPGSVNFLDMLGIDDSGGQAAAEGTIMHSFCESALREGRDAYDFVGQTREHEGFRLELTDETADLMQDGLDYIESIPGKLYIERRVDLARWMPGQFGTLDVGIAGRDLITIFDWKWGYQPVKAIKNVQLRIYGLGFWENFARHVTKATRFRFVIWQPFAPGGGGEWEVDLDDLLEFGKEVKKAAEATYPLDAPRIPGPVQCQYCEGAKQMLCKEYAEYNMAMIVEDFDDMDERISLGVGPRLNTAITPERRAFILRHKAMFEKFLERLHAEALDDALKGFPTPNQKAVYGRKSRRKWRDEADADERLSRSLGEDRFAPRKLMSPAMVEKVLPEKIYAKLDELIDHGEPKPILVDLDDAREPIQTIVDLFEDLDD